MQSVNLFILLHADFAQQSYKVIMDVKSNMLTHYDESIIWFSFYADMLVIIKIILYYNLDKTKIDIDWDTCHLLRLFVIFRLCVISTVSARTLQFGHTYLKWWKVALDFIRNFWSGKCHCSLGFTFIFQMEEVEQ